MLADPFRNHRFPRWIFIGGMAVMLASLILTGYGSYTQGPWAEKRAGTPVMERVLVFAKHSDESWAVHDAAADGALIHHLAPGPGDYSFIDGVMRSFGRDRLALGASPKAPFILTLWSDGSLSLTDPVTDEDIFLNAFGKDNVAAFASLLHAGEPLS